MYILRKAVIFKVFLFKFAAEYQWRFNTKNIPKYPYNTYSTKMLPLICEPIIIQASDFSGLYVLPILAKWTMNIMRTKNNNKTIITIRMVKYEYFCIFWIHSHL